MGSIRYHRLESLLGRPARKGWCMKPALLLNLPCAA